MSEQAVKDLEARGFVFCKEGGERHQAAGMMEHFAAEPVGDDMWLALAPMHDHSLHAMADEAVKWAADNRYESPMA